MVNLTELGKSFGALKVFERFTLEFPEKRITTILGPSGCGKTTLLNVLAGLIQPDHGRVSCPREVSYLFQEPRLLPWLTVRDNVKLVLEECFSPMEAAIRTEKYLTACKVGQYQTFYPRQLSGGLRQRVAMARAFSYPASLLLMDEPFQSLDVKTRFRLMTDFLRLWKDEPRTVVMVTHDPQEAALMGEFIVVLSEKPTTVLKTITPELRLEERDGPELFALEDAIMKVILKEE